MSQEQNKKRPMMGHGPGRGMMPGEKAKDFTGTIQKLFAYLGSYRIVLGVVILFAIGSTVFNIIGPKVLSKVTTELFNGLVAKVSGTGGIDFEKIGRILLLLLGIYCISAVFNFIQGWLMIGVLIMMLSISPLMTLIALVILPISGGLIGFVVKHSQKYFVEQQSCLGEINGQVEETYSGHMVIRAFNREEAVEETFSRTNDRLYESAWKSQFISGLMQPIMTFVGNLGYVAVAVLGSVLAVNGTIEVGDIQAFIQYVKNFTQPITQIAQVSNMLQSAAAAAERVFEFLDEEEEEQTVEHPVSMDQLTGAVSFEHVRFGYTPDKIVIQDFSCEVKPGQMVAIVGPTGAGKTTMVKLLMRFYDVNSGRICLDGHDIRNFNRGQLREMFGMVLQDTWLFQGTIMENIRYGRLDATDEEVIAAAKAAHADHFIRTLPGGYQMELNEDATNVSQGQKQLLTIARAILADNPILILDEATSSVDTRTEIQIQKAMNNLMKGRTSFVIAHRLSTIRDADVILVMKDGDIAEQGTHEELLAKGGFYAQLYNSQFEKTA